MNHKSSQRECEPRTQLYFVLSGVKLALSYVYVYGAKQNVATLLLLSHNLFPGKMTPKNSCAVEQFEAPHLISHGN